jgi:hypothetical protein
MGFNIDRFAELTVSDDNGFHAQELPGHAALNLFQCYLEDEYAGIVRLYQDGVEYCYSRFGFTSVDEREHLDALPINTPARPADFNDDLPF